ncbi:ATP-binding cassette domain-containing protein [Arthrobacter crystallopoietes]|uniref:ATP-binding cassette domain-containing protein n=1 Tax=Crystallibacter crystallopoietes TaxID=37928 RepID=UPI001ABDF8EA|nr:ABC transporter ATP-binding protein [Arthrobacter crystallopoietes]QTG82092.1 ABC transporter ATP-binding protein [Arthrobacter crystallopoietes]
MTQTSNHMAGETDPAGLTGTMLSVEKLSVGVGTGTRYLQILDDVDLTIRQGQTVGLVGESGSGKTTLGKALVGEMPITAGRIRVGGTDLGALSRSERLAMRRRVQLIPQDPYSSLSPRRTIGQTLAEAIDPRRADQRKHRNAIRHWLEKVSLPGEAAERYPHEFSGGQRQRIAIARALAVEPELIIADEVTSALDLTTQAEILNLLADLREDLGLTMLFISHNLAVVRHVSDQVTVLFRGVVVESGDVDRIYDVPQHPYTQQLIASVPGGPAFNIDA